MMTFPTNRIALWCCGIITLAVCLTCSATAQEREWAEVSEGERLFALQVAPALEAKCLACHGQDPESIESGLDLTSRQQALLGGDSGEPALVPGRKQDSWIYLSASWEHDFLQMPPKENDQLEVKSLEALGRWIDLGAPWPDASRVVEIREQLSTGMTVATSGGLDASWDQRRYEPEALWAYQPLAAPELSPATRLPEVNAIDRFINAQLDELGIEPAPRATRRQLIRRVYFDLLGLPPAPQAVQDFVDDPAPDHIAWEQLVDRVLASPHLGEQSARHWFDTVRYADSAGFANDYQRPNAWRYRDYVIRRLNEDVPLDRFITEQLAGDEIDPDDPEMLIAVGMLRMGPWEQTGMSVDKVTRQQFLDDVTDAVGQAFLGHPLQCARCHDHKFDPVPTRDYYRVQAVFATTQFAGRDAEFVDEESRSGFERQRTYLQRRIARYQEILDELSAKEEQAARAWYAERELEYAPRAQKRKAGVPEEEIAPRHVGFEPADFGLERIARKYLQRHRWELDRYRPIAMSVYSGPTPSRNNVNTRIVMPENPDEAGKLEQTAILTGGDPFSPATAVVPGVLSALQGIVGADNPRRASALSSDVEGRRTEFARWLTDPDRNPLTPRVMVNRLWQHHFGQGLVKTSNNFGTGGSPPTHPELLDYLASELIKADWSAKQIHRLILTSEAYCRSSSRTSETATDASRETLTSTVDGDRSQVVNATDPSTDSKLEDNPVQATENADTYARFPSRQLAAEELRDAALTVSGLLNRQQGGVPVRPSINPEVATQPRQIMGTYAPIYQASPLPRDRHRRTIYALKLRGLRDPMLETFNQPTPDTPCERRESSTIAPQALTLFNSPQSYEHALAMAERVISEVDDGHRESDEDAEPAADEPLDRESAIHRAFQLTYGRPPATDELEAAVEHWRVMERRHQSIDLFDNLPPTEVTREFVDENTGETFIYTELLEQNQDFQPSVRPSQTTAKTRGLAEVCLVLLSSNEFLYVP